MKFDKVMEGTEEFKITQSLGFDLLLFEKEF